MEWKLLSEWRFRSVTFGLLLPSQKFLPVSNIDSLIFGNGEIFLRINKNGKNFKGCDKAIRNFKIRNGSFREFQISILYPNKPQAQDAQAQARKYILRKTCLHIVLHILFNHNLQYSTERSGLKCSYQVTPINTFILYSYLLFIFFWFPALFGISNRPAKWTSQCLNQFTWRWVNFGRIPEFRCAQPAEHTQLFEGILGSI